MLLRPNAALPLFQPVRMDWLIWTNSLGTWINKHMILNIYQTGSSPIDLNIIIFALNMAMVTF